MTLVTIATWNVNSIKARLEHAQKWFAEAKPDVILLQELKTETDAFPHEAFEDMGYNLAIYGQKTYNGVAILSKHPIDDVITALPDDESDIQARYIEGLITVDGTVLRIASVYVPNGQSPDSEKFQYKMNFYDRLKTHMAELLTYDEPVIVGADYNLAPSPIDVYDPEKLDGTVCFHPLEREAFRRLLNLGYYDAWRELNPNIQQFSWWDYRGGGYQRGNGLRIDHMLLNGMAMDKLESSVIDETPRGWEKPSDHAPVLVTLNV